MFRHAHVAAFKPDSAKAELADYLGGGVLNLRFRLADVRLQTGALLGDLFRKPGIAHQERPLPAEHEIAGFSTEAGQVGDINRIGDEESIQVFFLDQPGQRAAAANCAGRTGHRCLRFGGRSVLRSFHASIPSCCATWRLHSITS